MRFLIAALKTLSLKEKWVLIIAAAVFFISSSLLSFEILKRKTDIVPVAGGEYTEGMVGQPKFINPVLGSVGESDTALIKLVFDDLLSMAESYKKSGDNKVFNIRLKENIFWHDGQPITSDDIIFTIDSIQNADSNSLNAPALKSVKAERVSEKEIKIILQSPYYFFENILKELRPMPKHIFGDIPASNFRLSEYNLEPIGSGPFKFASFDKKRDGFITTYTLTRNENYFNKKPYLDSFIFKFYKNQKELIESFNSGTIDGFWGLSGKNISALEIRRSLIKAKMPRYYAVFLNPYSTEILKEKNIRTALDYATDKKLIIDAVFNGNAIKINNPVLSWIWQIDENFSDEFSYEKAGALLESDGWILNNDGIREKKFKNRESATLEINLIAPDVEFLKETAEIIKENWKNIGVKVNVSFLSPEKINEALKTRNYEAVIFGNIFGNNPDLYSFWHSSEKFYPGLNLAMYENKIVDALIESVRRGIDADNIGRDVKKIKGLFLEDRPAVFLFSPEYFYAFNNNQKIILKDVMFMAEDRFDEVENWHIKTARVFK